MTVLKITRSEFLALSLGQTPRNVITWLKGMNILKFLRSIVFQNGCLTYASNSNT